MGGTVDGVWAAFRAWHRYAVRVGSKGGLPVPRTLPLTLSTAGEAMKAAQGIADQVRILRPDYPIECSAEYYVYCYLWAQVLRVSKPQGPTMLRPGQWRNLCWYPLAVLRGRWETGKPAAAWRRWYYEWIQQEHPRPSQADLERNFPWLPEYGEHELATARRQLTVLRRVQAEDGLAQCDVTVQCDVTGKPGGRPADWHPWLLLAMPETCTSPRALRELDNLVDAAPGVLESWHGFLKEAQPDEQQRWLVLHQLGSIIKEQRTWRNARRWAQARQRCV